MMNGFTCKTIYFSRCIFIILRLLVLSSNFAIFFKARISNKFVNKLNRKLSKNKADLFERFQLLNVLGISTKAQQSYTTKLLLTVWSQRDSDKIFHLKHFIISIVHRTDLVFFLNHVINKK